MKKAFAMILLAAFTGCAAVIPESATVKDTPAAATVAMARTSHMDGYDSTRRARVEYSPNLELTGPFSHAVTGLKPDVEWRSGETSAPIVMGDVVVYGTAAKAVRAVEWKTGNVLWEHKLRGGLMSSPAYFNDMFFVADNLGWVEGLDRKGNKVWESRMPGPVIAPVLENSGRIYVFSIDQNLFCFDPRKGTPVWRYESKQKAEGSLWNGSAPAILGGRLFAGFSDGQVVALDAEYGRVLWKKTITEKVAFPDVSSGPVADGKFIYIGAISGLLASMKADTGEMVWKTKHQVTGSMAVDENNIYFGTIDGKFHAVRKTDGGEVWSAKLSDGVSASPVSAGPYVYVGSTEGGMHKISAIDGDVVEVAYPGSGIQARPYVGDQGIAFISNAGVLHLYDGKR